MSDNPKTEQSKIGYSHLSNDPGNPTVPRLDLKIGVYAIYICSGGDVNTEYQNPFCLNRIKHLTPNSTT